MQTLRFLTIGTAALTLAAGAAAQFDGPAPLAWRSTQPSTSAPSGSPVVVGDKIYLSSGGRVYSMDLETGNMRWRFPVVDPIPGTFRTAPVIVNGVMVVVGDNKLAYGVDPVTGVLKWSFPTGVGIIGQPVAVGGAVVMGTSDNHLVAINAADGTPLWQEGPEQIFDGINGQLGAFQDDVLVFTGRQELYAINLVTRKSDWHRRLDSLPPNPTPVVYGDTVYLTSGSYVVAINAVNGNPRWQIPTSQIINLPPTVNDNGIFVVSQDGNVLAWDLSRTPITKTPISLGTLAEARPTAVGNFLVVPTSAGGVELVDVPNGKVVWNYLIRPGDSASSVAKNSNPGQPTGFGQGSNGGSNVGQNRSDREAKVVTVQASGPAVVVGTTLLVPAKDGSLLAFDRNLGVDLTPPTVKMVFPNSGDQVSGQPPLMLVYKLEDVASGINDSSIKVTINGEAYDYTFTKEGLLVIRFTASPPAAGTISSNGAVVSRTKPPHWNRPLSEGRKSIEVTVSDWMGNETTQKFSLVIDNTLRPIVIPGSDTNSQNPGGGPGGKGGGGGGFGGGGGAG